MTLEDVKQMDTSVITAAFVRYLEGDFMERRE